MSKISERRERTANTKIYPKAYLAEAPAQKKEYIYKKILIAFLAIVAVVACVLLMINAVIDAQAKKFVNAPEHSTAVATAPVTGVYYDNTDYLLENVPKFRDTYKTVIDNMSRPEVVNPKYDENVYNYIITINSDKNPKSSNLTIIMLLSFDKAADKVTYVYVNKFVFSYIPTVGVGPLYDAYGFGGTALLARTIEENYGIAINGYADMPLDSFVVACADVGGITVDGVAYETKEEIYNYVDLAEDRELAVKNVVTALAKGTKEEKLFGACKVALKIIESTKANISRNNIGELLQMGVGVFKKAPSVGMLGYDSAKSALYQWKPSYSDEGIRDRYFDAICDYETEIAKIQNLLYPVAEGQE